MTNEAELHQQLAEIISDYRQGEISAPTARHVARWVEQFDPGVRAPILKELVHVFGRTYFSKTRVKAYLRSLLKDERFSNGAPKDFWSQAHIFNIQVKGSSQRELHRVLMSLGDSEFGQEWNKPALPPKCFVYLDDIIFSGHRVSNDLTEWMRKNTPSTGKIKIVVMAAHESTWDLCRKLGALSTLLGKKLEFEVHAAHMYENRKAYRDQSAVLWPIDLPDTPQVANYMKRYQSYAYIGRKPLTPFSSKVFSSETGRSLLEREMLLAGIRIISFSQNPKVTLPLGYGDYGLGFGSLAITYRNCPNNAPLALWWGDPEASAHHPFSKWYPLLPRKTYYA